MFLHQGQKHIKELRFHPYFDTVMFTTAEDSFNVFKPNMDPDEQIDDDEEENELKEVNKRTKELQKMIDAQGGL